MIKNKLLSFFGIILFMQILVVTAFAADVTLTLSKQSGYAGDNIIVSGSYAPNEWITIKAIDADGNIVFIDPAKTADDGTFSLGFIMPEVDPGTLTFVAGSGSDVSTAEFTVKANANISGDTSGSNNDDDTETSISDESGNTISGTIEKTENGEKIDIPRKSFEGLAEQSNSPVTLDLKVAKLTFDGSAIDSISGSSDNGDISITVEQIDPSTLSSEAKARVGDHPVYDFTLMAGNTQISDFGGTATIKIPYELANGEKPNAIVVYYIADNGEITPVRGRYDAKTGTVVFTVTHFSVYAVAYNYVSFNDVSDNDWYYNAVTFCAAREITNGTGDDMFSPNDKLTREQFLVMLMRSYGIEPQENVSENFDDAGSTYYTNYLAAAKQQGISNGIGNNLFAPESKITRQDMFTLVYRALDVIGELPRATSSLKVTDFNDAADISDYALDAMNAFVEAGVVSGSDGKLNPIGSSTRAQMVQVLYNLLG